MNVLPVWLLVLEMFTLGTHHTSTIKYENASQCSAALKEIRIEVSNGHEGDGSAIVAYCRPWERVNKDDS